MDSQVLQTQQENPHHINIKYGLEKEFSPSRLSLYIRLATLDKDGTGFVKLEEIKDDDPVIESIRTATKDYLNNTSFLSALFAFSMLTIVAQTNPPSGLPAEPYAYDVLDNATEILATYIILAVFGMICELVACLICVYWYNKLCSQTPSAEDVVLFLLNHNMILPVGVLTLGIYSIIFSLSCIIFVNYGRKIGTIVSAISGLPLVAFVVFLALSRKNTVAGLKRKACLLSERYQKNEATSKATAESAANPNAEPEATKDHCDQGPMVHGGLVTVGV
jgi:hypothetical protein